MRTKLVEVSQGPEGFNYGKFMIGEFTSEEWSRKTVIGEDVRGLVRSQGWDRGHLLVLDLATGEGAIFRVTRGNSATADLQKHAVHVCPLFEPFLAWLHENCVSIDELPDQLELPNAPAAMYGYRRPGKPEP